MMMMTMIAVVRVVVEEMMTMMMDPAVGVEAEAEGIIHAGDQVTC